MKFRKRKRNIVTKNTNFVKKFWTILTVLIVKLCVRYTISLQRAKIVQCSLTKSVFWITNFILGYKILFSFTKFHFRVRNSALDYQIFLPILGYEICILGYQIWISNTKSRFRKIEVKGIRVTATLSGLTLERENRFI